MKTPEADDGRVELRAVTGPDYGRIWDHELVGLLNQRCISHENFLRCSSDMSGIGSYKIVQMDVLWRH